jgi:hypothetical protein
MENQYVHSLYGFQCCGSVTNYFEGKKKRAAFQGFTLDRYQEVE